MRIRSPSRPIAVICSDARAQPSERRRNHRHAGCALVAGGAHTRALTQHGGVGCWGQLPRDQLGDGTTNNRRTPVPSAVPESFATDLERIARSPNPKSNSRIHRCRVACPGSGREARDTSRSSVGVRRPPPTLQGAVNGFECPIGIARANCRERGASPPIAVRRMSALLEPRRNRVEPPLRPARAGEGTSQIRYLLGRH